MATPTEAWIEDIAQSLQKTDDKLNNLIDEVTGLRLSTRTTNERYAELAIQLAGLRAMQLPPEVPTPSSSANTQRVHVEAVMHCAALHCQNVCSATGHDVTEAYTELRRMLHKDHWITTGDDTWYCGYHARTQYAPPISQAEIAVRVSCSSCDTVGTGSSVGAAYADAALHAKRSGAVCLRCALSRNST